MEISNVAGTGDSRGKRFVVEFYEQWSAFFSPSRMNWFDFTIVKMQGEFSPYKGSCEFEIWVLGLGLAFTYIYDFTFVDHVSDLQESIVTDLKAATGAAEIVDATGTLQALKDNNRKQGSD